jgi:hypothetical protein
MVLRINSSDSGSYYSLKDDVNQTGEKYYLKYSMFPVGWKLLLNCNKLPLPGMTYKY